MKRSCVIYNIDISIILERYIWIINKNNPSKPLLKLNEVDFNIIKTGVFKKHNNPIRFNEEIFWFPKDIFDKINDKANLGLSFIEFIDNEYINNYKVSLNNAIDILKDIKADIYLITEKFLGKKHKGFLEKIKNELIDKGILIKDIYCINKTYTESKFNNVDIKEDIVLTHVIGKKIQNSIVTDQAVERYFNITVIDSNDLKYLNIQSKLNDMIKYIDPKLYNEILPADIINTNINYIYMTNNSMSKYMTKKVSLKIPTIIT